MRSKKEIVKEIMQKLEVTRSEAEDVFRKAFASGDIRRIWDWKKVVDALVVCSLIVASVYCLFNLLTHY